MAALEFELPPTAAERAAIAAPPYRRAGRPGGRARLAMISTYSELCGIAAYTRSLEKQLADAFDVTVFDLDQYLLRGTLPAIRRLGDRHIREICRAIKWYDAVNLQLEHGTLGRFDRDIYRRFNWIVRAAPRLSVTFHTTFPPQSFDYGAYAQALLRFDFTRAAALRAEYGQITRSHLLSMGIPKRLRQAQRLKPVTAIVHNRRDALQMKHVHRLRNVYDHPLSFLDAAEIAETRRAASRRNFAVLDGVPDDAKLIGVFGFYGRYKGFETVVQAMHHLPPDYHLLVFGGVHPNEIKRHQRIDPVISTMFEAGYVDLTVPEILRVPPTTGGPALSVTVDGSQRDLFIRHPKDLSRRIHFLGSRSDGEFVAGMAICDAVVFPYLEVGQSSSGPISLALELGCRVIASRTHTFLQFGRYHRDRIEYFDIGNHLELAAHLKSRRQFLPDGRPLAYSVETNKAVYIAANGGAGRAAPARALA